MLVKHVWLNIELKSYTCRSCDMTESSSWTSGNNTIIRRAISKLFFILSTWNLAGYGLTLELSAQSPSDSEHWFKNFCFGVNNTNNSIILESGNHLQEITANLHDLKHGWVNGQQATGPNRLAILRLHEVVEFKFLEEHFTCQVCILWHYGIIGKEKLVYSYIARIVVVLRLPGVVHGACS